MQIDTHAVRAYLDEAHHALAETLADFVAETLAPLPHCESDQAAREASPGIVAAMGQAGMIARALPRQYGGSGVDFRACGLIREAIAGASPLADELFALQCLGSQPLVQSGSEALCQRWLPGVCRGELIAGFAMTEIAAGSDVSATSTRAVREEDAYRINGSKSMISNAGIADYYIVFASTDPDAGARGITAILVPADSPGLSWTAQHLSDPHPLGTLTFEDVRVPLDHLLGEEGAGFKVGMRTLDRLRGTVGAAACGMAGYALDQATDHVRQTIRFGAPLSDNPIVQHMLAAGDLDLEASRLLVYRALAESDSGAERVTREAALAKCFATEAAQRVIDRAVQLHGGRGVLLGTPVERLYRAIRALRIYEGTTEIQHLVIAGQRLRRAAENDRA